MKPLIKWAGGKSGEIHHIERMIPQYRRYFEPFFGGGAVYFDLEPREALINDITTELVDFYRYIQNGQRAAFRKELEKYVSCWKRIDEYIAAFGVDIFSTFDAYRKGKIAESAFTEKIRQLFAEKIVPFDGLFSDDFAIDKHALLRRTQESVVRKLRRVRKNVDTENTFSEREILKNVETAFRAGFYTHFRSVMNESKRGSLVISKERRTANYYFIREFCYGGMFRFNRNGEFNVPYGGNAYNRKDFEKKVSHAFSEPVRQLLRRATIENMDFEAFLKKHKPGKDDFIFLDPPYDTEFSEYEESPFTKDDQRRLARFLKGTRAKFILIIKETPFIRSLYEGKKGIRIASFEKAYLFNIRDRNERGVRHLVIHNLRTEEQKTLAQPS